MVVLVAVLALGASVAAARSFSSDELRRDHAAACATAVQFARHHQATLERCVTRAVRTQFDRVGVVDALVALQRDANRSPVLKAMCHLSMHELGREQLRAGLRIAELDHPLEPDANWNSSCVGGFLHGYLQAMAEGANRAQLRDVARSWCATLADQNRRGCAHAVGHGLARVNRNDLPAAAADCARLPASLHDDCLAGAVMELDFADPRLADRMRADTGLAAPRPSRCGELPHAQRTRCRLLLVKGEALILGLRT